MKKGDIKPIKNEYDLESLKQGLVKIDKNVKAFEDAIKKEKQTKQEYLGYIMYLEEKGEEDNLAPLASKS